MQSWKYRQSSAKQGHTQIVLHANAWNDAATSAACPWHANAASFAAISATSGSLPSIKASPHTLHSPA